MNGFRDHRQRIFLSKNQIRILSEVKTMRYLIKDLVQNDGVKVVFGFR